MLKFFVSALDGGNAILSLDTNDAEKFIEHKYSGDRISIEIVKSMLANAYGLFGHFLSANSPAIDLQYALRQSGLGFQVIEGQEILDKWKPPIFPKGSIS